MAEATVTIELELAGFLNGWTDVSDDVELSEGIDWNRGLPGTGVLDRVAKIGELRFTLDNSANNSAATLGYYTPGHASARPGFAKNIGVRLSIVVGAVTYPHFTGRLEHIRPTAGDDEERVTRCVARDYMNELAKKRLSTLELQTNIADHDAFALIVAAMPLQPRALRITDGFDTLAYVFDTTKDERSVPMSEMQRLNQSTLAMTFVEGDGTLVYEPRSIRARDTVTNLVTLTAADLPTGHPPDIDDDRSKLINRYLAKLHPRFQDGTTVLLYQQPNPFPVEPGTPIAIRGYYTDPGQRAFRAGGLDVVEPVSGVDYVFNTAADGSGTDVTASCTVEATVTANSILFTITAPVSCWLTTLQARGTALLDNADTGVEDEDEDSIDEFGENPQTLDMPYGTQAGAAFANEVVKYLLFLTRQTSKHVKGVTLCLNHLSEARAQLMAAREISHRIGVADDLVGLPSGTRLGFHINSVTGRLAPDGTVWLTWVPALSDSTQYWTLDIVGYSELDFTTVLAFGLVIGHTDVAHEDAHADTAHSDTAHVDAHSDVAHQDAAHADSAHSDTAHSDTAHVDVAHADSHSDVGHVDVAHADSHSDVAHVDSHGDTAHVDSHTDSAHGDVHGDGSHTDIVHTDYHNDAHGDEGFGPDHNDYHDDEFIDYPHEDLAHEDSHTNVPHSDVPHLDGAHTDSHTDDAHADSHGDTAHTDGSHSDAHGDTAHTDVSHADSHTDAGHGDAAHADVTHTDAHVDVLHSDVTHADSHSDLPHGDAN